MNMKYHEMGVAQNSWMVYFMEHPKQKWMMTGERALFRETSIYSTILGHRNLITFVNLVMFAREYQHMSPLKVLSNINPMFAN